MGKKVLEKSCLFLKLNTKKRGYFPVVIHWICGGIENKSKTSLIQSYPKEVQCVTCPERAPWKMLLLSLRKGENYDVNLVAWVYEIQPKLMTCLPWSPAHDRFYILKEALFQRILGRFITFSDSLHKCCDVCLPLLFGGLLLLPVLLSGIWHQLCPSAGRQQN